MIRYILFPYMMRDDNKKAFAFTIELARRSNSEIIALTRLESEKYQIRRKAKLTKLKVGEKNHIYCNLLEMQGYYHGRFNQWKAFNEIKIHSQIVQIDMNSAICAAINENPDLTIVLQQRYFAGTGLYEEILSNTPPGNVSFFLLPQHREFDVISAKLKRKVFQKLKRSAFIEVLNETKIFDLPEDREEFKVEMILQQAI